jgi:methionyl-tRNA formyltransferase
MERHLRIIFMGTPDFAVPSLEILVRHGFDVAAVITAPDKPAGRGLQMQASPVKQFALRHQIPVLQPLRLKDPVFLEELRGYHANLQIVVAFRMLPELVWNMPEYGTFNLHASLLPDYRGAAPINRAIMNGEPETGLTTFFLQHEIDTGDILFQKKLTIGPDETAGELHDRMSVQGAGLVLETVKAIAEDKVKPFPQPQTSIIKTAPKIFKEDCRIDWQQPLDRLHDFVRGLSPYPAAWTMLNGKVFKIYRTAKEKAESPEQPGSWISDSKNYIKVAVNGGYLHLLEIHMEGKKRMPVKEFLKGFPVKDGLSFE